MSERVVVELDDFISNHTSESLHQEQNELGDESSSLKTLDLIHLLKQGFGKKHFSLNFDKIETINLSSGHGFDLVISDEYNKIIIADGHYLNVYNRPFSVETFKLLFQVEFSDSQFYCMKLVKEKGVEYIYLSCRDDFVIKIRVSDLMKNQENPGELQICWKSTCKLANICKLDICKGKVYVIQYFSTEIQVLDSESGQLIEENGLPHVSNAYGIHFLSESEMLISQKGCLELFEKQQDGQWISIKSKQLNSISLFAIFYEAATQLIYVGDLKGIHVVKLDDFSIVKQQSSTVSIFGMVVDPNSGLFYVCTDGKYVSVYQ